jgi:PAS domain S-box-containing protein
MMNSQESSNRLRKALFFYLATALLVLVFSLALTITFTLFGHLKRAEDSRMIHAAQTRAMTIAEWCRRAKDLAWQITSRTRIRQELENYNQGNISRAEVRAFTAPKLQDAMDLSQDIIGILRLDNIHRIIAACGNGAALPKTVKTIEDYVFNDIKLLEPFTINGRLSIVVSAPIRNRNGVRQGTDLVVLDADRLWEIFSNSKPPGRASSVVIAYPSNEDIAYFFPSTEAPVEAPERPEMSKAIKTAVSEAIAGHTGIANIAETLLAYVPVEESKWGLVITQDESELYAPLYRKMANIGILFLLIYLLILLGFGVVLKPLAGRILLHADDLERKIQKKTASLERNERKLRDLTRKLEMAQQLAKSGWWEYDVRADTIHWPEETYALYGLDPETRDLDYNRLLQCIHPDYRDYHNQQLQVILTKGAAEFQYPIECPDGERRWIWARGETVCDENAEPIKLFGTLQDITDAKRTEQEREQLITDLKEAIGQVRTLSGLLPMCANCKKVRDDSGYWNQLEAYISKHTNADVSHGLCPECMDEMYSGQAWYEDGKQKGVF